MIFKHTRAAFVAALLLTFLSPFTAGRAQSSSETAHSFIDVSRMAGIAASHRGIWDPDHSGQGYLGVGAAWGDYNNNGFLDLYVTGNLAGNVLYENQGNGSFRVSEFSSQVSLQGAMSGGALWADVNNNGWKDLYVVNNGANVLFMNDEGRGFIDITEEAGVGDTGKGASATWGDYNGNGFLDLYVVNWSCIPECDPEDDALSSDRLYHNNGDGTFTDVTHTLPGDKTQGAGFAASFVDITNNGRLDIYVVNDKVRNPIGNVLWRNDGPGCGHWCWSEASAETNTNEVIHSMGIAVGDYRNNQQHDIYISNMMSPMVLLENQGDGTFSNVTQAAGVGVNPPGNAVGWGVGFVDFDNDGWKDLYLAATGMPPLSGSFYGGTAPDMEDFLHPYPDMLFRNNADGTFTDVSEQSWVSNEYPSMGFTYADFDNDGWVDFVQGNWNEGYRLYRNVGARHLEHNWLTIHLIGGGSINRDAVGARAYVTSSEGVTQMREVIIGSSLGAGNDPRLHFGLGEGTVEQVEIVWPNGLRQTFRWVPHNQIWQLQYVNAQDDGAAATDWFSLALELIQGTPGFSPPVASRALGYMGVTLYEAVAPGLEGYQSLAGQLNELETLPKSIPGETYHWPSVASSALASISRTLFASASAENLAKIDALEATHAQRFQLEQDADTLARSVAYGREVAGAIYDWSLTDGGHEGQARNFPEGHQQPASPGLWVSTPPAFAGALQPHWGDNRPFVLASGDACPVTPPYAYSEAPTSAFYAEALEVYHTVNNLSPEELEIARFWADDPGDTPTPPGHWTTILTQILSEGGYGLERAAVAYTKLGMALADSFIACWDAKYQYNVVRPISYIQHVIDPSWNTPEVTDPVITPPFPEYPSGHSVQSAAAAVVLTELFGEVPFTNRTHEQRGFQSHDYPSFFAAAEEAAMSRLYGGIHFRAAIESGLAQGRCIGEAINTLQFKVR